MNNRTAILSLLAASLLLSLLYLPPVNIVFDDSTIFAYTGRVIAHGGVPYKDVFDHKPPLIFFFNYAGLLLGPWGLWLIDAVLVMLVTIPFFRLCQKHGLAWPWIPPILFNLLLRNYEVCWGFGMTREYTAIFLLLFFCLLLNRSRYCFFWMGLLTAATFFMQQDQVIILLPFWLYALADSRTRPILPAIAGFLTLSAPILLYFGWNHALPYFWECAFQFNFSWYTEKQPLIIHFRSIKEGLERTQLQLTFLLALAAACCALLLQTTKKGLVTAALTAVLLSFISEYLSGNLILGHAFYYYFLALSSTLPILVFTVWAYTKEDFLAGRKSQAFYGFLLCFLPFYNALQHGTHLTTHDHTLQKTAPGLIWLRQQHLQDHQLFVFGSNDWIYLYNELDLIAPSRWVYQHFWTNIPGWDADHRQLRTITEDLLRHQTKYVFCDLRSFEWKDPSARTYWLSFLQQYYQPVPDMPLIWQLKRSGQ